MGLGRLLRPRAATHQDETRSITEFAIIDGIRVDGTGESVFGTRYQGGLKIPGAWRASLLISDLIGSVPWYAYRRRAGNPIEQLDPTPSILEQPNPDEPGMATRSSWALDLVWHGNAVGIIAARNAEGWPTAVVPVPVSMVGVRRVLPGGMSSVLPVGAIEYAIGGLVFAADEVIHIKGPCQPGEVRGLGVLEAHLSTLNLAHELSRQAQAVAQHGVPTGTLKSDNPDLTREEAEELKSSWLRSQRERSVAVLNATTAFTPLSWNPEELELVESRKFSLHELSLIFGLPLSFLGADQATRTYSNIEQEALNLLKFSLNGHIARFEQTLSLQLPRGTWAKADLDSILRADTLTRYQAHQIGLSAGFLTVDEVRDTEDLPPMPEPPPPPPPNQPPPPPGVDGQPNDATGTDQPETGQQQ